MVIKIVAHILKTGFTPLNQININSGFDAHRQLLQIMLQDFL
jgi:hypothetical protein